ncbi:NAD-dependent succinate-semialdehyde dehydrogenase [Arthrobacter sp. MMS18-M83]|uniref:NAD-dependent succinate-semialdehyde dehydrogenase n=1 Tax=Arthrobacter sp. MMS18-M83 TaxID=2996261 RepID=UPI00227BC9C5|nr:NAD-dependent succinate-semialdehyde dehydrogenase [Arthrobacter sp. MMS18-M83]WAH96324.1 NAD-dependent succinate-semialdehyde dehydrogenase [Arthrobacter sp. MMS18-M83]
MTVSPTSIDEMVISLVPKDLLIDGRWMTADGDRTFDVIDPSTGEVLCAVADASPADGRRALEAAVAAQATFARTTPRSRAQLLKNALALLQERTEQIAAIMSLEAGKPLAEARAEIASAGDFILHFAEEAVRIEGNYQENPVSGGRMIVTRQPIGTAILITPWNFPLSQAARKLAPAIAAGCTSVVKPAKETPLTLLAFAEVLKDAGVPDGVVNVVTTSDSNGVMEPLIRSGLARKLSFTGSTPVGVKLLEQAAEQVLSSSMELGGNAPFIVFEDADLDVAIDSLILNKMWNAGQTCTSANRIYVHASVIDRFQVMLTERMSGYAQGRGVDDGVTLGPLINAKQLASVHAMVTDALDAGAKLVLGGAPLDRPGFFYPPTILRDVPADAALNREEIFGPVAALIPFETEEDVVKRANDTDYGLVSYIFTEDLRRAVRVSEAMDSGNVGLNRGTVAYAAAPFGGVKKSGLGREGGKDGIEEFLETKFIALQL